MVALAFPVWSYVVLDIFIRNGWSKYSPMGLLTFLGATAAGCAVAWLVVRPVRILWFRWPWWSFALLGAGWAAKAWLLGQSRPWPEVAAALIFYLVTVGFHEEFIFRGCVEEGLSDLGPWTAAIVAGLFFGLGHAPLAIHQGAPPAMAVLNVLGGGVLYQLAARWLRDKGGLAFPMLVHGLMDFMGAR